MALLLKRKKSGKLLCEFNDGATHEYKLKQIETFACQQVEESIESDTTESDDSFEESSSDEASSEEASDSDDDARERQEGILIHMHLTGTLLFAAMELPKGQIEARCRNLTLDGRPVEVMEYPTKEQSSNILDSLKFDENFTSTYN
mmetsp:Transcript_10352/g.17589  ORF Transcript_10352/g.17589 Transcript_10352/m.17589 type:complete len:146 (-) Transcript_10352:954-1391(-)